MSYPQALISNGLEDNKVVLVLNLELPLLRNRTILPNLVHTVNTTKHLGEASGLINGHLALKILTCGLSQVSGLKTYPHCLYKALHALMGCGLPQSTIFIARICRQSTCKYPQCCGAFLQCAQSQPTNCINTLDE